MANQYRSDRYQQYRNRDRGDQRRDFNQQEQFDQTSHRQAGYDDSRSQFGVDEYGQDMRQAGDDYGDRPDYRSDRRDYGNRSDSSWSRDPASHGSHGSHDMSGRSRYGSRSQFDSFNSNDFGGRDFSAAAQDMGMGNYAGGRTWYPGSMHGSAGARSYAPGRSNYGHDEERGFFERAGDEIASWFGDDDAARRREMDHRGRGPSNYTRSDERILEDACDRLSDDSALDARNITVSVASGEVTLDGTVESRFAKRRAEDCVDGLSGVKHVQNNLRVQTSSRYGETATES